MPALLLVVLLALLLPAPALADRVEEVAALGDVRAVLSCACATARSAT